MKKLIFAIGLIFVSNMLSSAQSLPSYDFINHKTDIPEEKLKPTNRLPWGMYVYLNSAYQYSTWIPLKSDSADDPIIEYETTGFHQIRLKAGLGLKDEDFIDFVYEGPLVNSPKQRAMFEANIDREQGVEKYTGSLMLRPIYLYLNNDRKSFLSKFINFLLTFRIRYSKELYFGSIKSERDFFYVPLKTDFDINRFDELNLPLVNMGHPFSFKSQFVDVDYSVGGSVESETPTQSREVRIGYIHSKFSRPSDYYRLYNNSNVPILFETEYSAKAIWAGIEENNPNTSKLNYNFRLIYGAFEHKVRNANISINDYTKENEGASPYYLACDASCWVNKTFHKTQYGSFSITFSGHFHLRGWMVGFMGRSENDETTYLDSDIIIKLFIGMSYKF